MWAAVAYTATRAVQGFNGMQDLERLLSDLKTEDRAAIGPDVDDAVWRRIGSIRESRIASVRQLPIRAAMVVGALGVGLALGGASAAQDHHDHEAAALSVGGHLAPSNLLVGG